MIVVDVETSGLLPHVHGIIEIGAINFDNPEHWFCKRGRPSASVEISQGALDVNGITREELQDCPDPMVAVLSEFLQWCSKQETSMILAGHNVGFDHSFILREMERCGLDRKLNPFQHRTFDLHTLAYADYYATKGFFYAHDFSATEIYERLGIPNEPSPHYALNGAIWEAEAISRILCRKNLIPDFADYPVLDNPWR